MNRPLLLAAALAACDAAPADDDELVARETLAALAGNSAQLRLYDGLLGQVDLRGLSLALAPKQVISQVEAGLAASLADPACHRVTTDQHSFLELTFTDCRYRGVYVDGVLRIDLTAEPGSCDGTPCVVATRYTTTLTDFTAGPTHTTAATSTLRIPAASGEPRSYTADASFTDADDRALHLRHELTWLRAGPCVTAQLGAAITIDELEISVGAEDVEVCGACPRAGDVQVAWSSGRTLAWTYTGDPTLVVRGPHGRRFTLDQTCDDPS